MPQDPQYAPNTGSPLLVTLGRWAGFFTIASALILGVLQTMIVAGRTPLSLDLIVFTLWRAIIEIAPWGVIIILLAEIADRVLDTGDIEPGKTEDVLEDVPLDP